MPPSSEQKDIGRDERFKPFGGDRHLEGSRREFGEGKLTGCVRRDDALRRSGAGNERYSGSRNGIAPDIQHEPRDAPGAGLRIRVFETLSATRRIRKDDSVLLRGEQAGEEASDCKECTRPCHHELRSTQDCLGQA